MINSNLSKLSKRYLFSEVGELVRRQAGAINLSIGDVKLPIPAKVVEVGASAARELSKERTFRGYPPECGYDFFRRAVVGYYEARGVTVGEDEVFASDGIKSDLSVFLNVLSRGKVILPTPTYPAYIDANILLGNELIFCTEPPKFGADVVIICSPDNPTGRAMSAEELYGWVSYCNEHGVVLLFDAAYEAFVTSGAPRSIFEIPNSRTCAVEFCSLSKTAGFTGIRCGYTVVPRESELNSAWRRVKSCMTNGVSYITQRMAECALSEALREVQSNVGFYLSNAKLMAEALAGADFCGGTDSPYIWLKCGNSNEAFGILLGEYGLGVTPGIGFGEAGKEFVRINAFCTREEAIIAAEKLKSYKEKYLT